MGKSETKYVISKNIEQGFRKIDPDKWEFANEEFLRGHRHLLKNIKRRRAPPLPSLPSQSLYMDPCVEGGLFGMDTELQRLKRDKQVLMMEMVKLRQQHQNTRVQLQAIEQRLVRAEMKQQQMMNFLARAMQNPSFIRQLTQQKEIKRMELEEALHKKRRRPPICDDHHHHHLKAEPQADRLDHHQVSELEALAIEMQGLDCVHEEYSSEAEAQVNEELDDEFWEELLNQGFNESGQGEADEGEDIDPLVVNWESSSK
ncbi:hypothetical protein Dimus_032309 [Dionaea muscipula]